MKRIICKRCKKFLAEVTYGNLMIKCPNSRCKEINEIKVISQKDMLFDTLFLVERKSDIIKLKAHRSVKLKSK